MERLKKKIEKELENTIHNQNQSDNEIEIYKEIMSEEIFKDKTSNQPDPFSLLLLLINAKNEKSLEENYKTVAPLNNNKLLKESILLTEVIKQLRGIKEYELCLLEEVLEILNKNFLDKWLNKKIMEKNIEKLKDKIEILNMIEKCRIPVTDMLMFIKFYHECLPSERKIFEWIRSYIALLIVYEHTEEDWKNINDKYKEDFKEINNVLVDYQKKLERNQKNKMKSLRRLENLYQKRLEELNQITKETYLEIREEEIQKYPIELLEEMEETFALHNQKIIENLEKKIKSYHENNQNRIKEIFIKYQIPVTEKELEEIIELEIDKEILEKRVQEYKNLNIEDIKTFIKLLKLEQKTFEIIKSLIRTNRISIHFLIQNKENIVEEKNILKMQENLNFLKEQKVDLEDLNEILLLEKQEIKRKIDLAKIYNLNSWEGIFKDYFFDTLDIWIEEGIYSFFEKNKEIIEKDFVNITKRILIGKKLGLPIFDEQGKILPVFKEEKKFYINDPNLDNYINNQTKYFIKEENEDEKKNEKMFTILEQCFYKEPLIYEIEGTKISRPKVFRNKEKNIDCVSKILYGSVLNYQECEKIKNKIEVEMKEYSLTNKKIGL